jgi:hypothetical protein
MFKSIKKGITVYIIFMCLTCCAASSKPGHILKENGKIRCEVVVPAEAGTVTLFAGKEMCDFLSQSLGGNVPLLKVPSGNKTAIILGNSKYLKKAGIDVRKFPRDGFIIKSAGKNIIIAGRDDMKIKPEQTLDSMHKAYYEKATLFGVYDFLERFAGVRFFFPGELGTVVPEHSELAIASDLNIFEKPDYSERKVSWCGRRTGPLNWLSNKNPRYWYKQKNLMYYRLKLETDSIPFCPGPTRYDYVKRFGKSHPEYFALRQDGRRYKEADMIHTGQLCLSSGIKNEIYEDAKAYFSGKKAVSRGIAWKNHFRYYNGWPSAAHSEYFDLMPQDGFYKCKCKKCQAHFSKGRQATSDFVWQYVIDIANRLKKDGIKGYVTNMAYSPYNLVPTQRIPDNVLVKIATIGPWNFHKPSALKYELQLIAKWTEKMNGQSLCLWNYACKFGLAIPDVPHCTPRAVGGYYQMLGNKIKGSYLETNAITPEVIRYSHGYLNNYIFAKVAWNNSADINALIKDHHQKMFGAAAEIMGKAFDEFEKNWLKITGSPVDTPVGPRSVPLSDYDIWEKVYSKKEMVQLKNFFDRAERLAANDELSLKRVKFIRNEFLVPLQKRRAQYLKNQKVINDLRFSVKSIGQGEKIVLDGRLDDKVWRKAAQITLVPYADEKKKKEFVRTVVKALRDKNNIYLAFDCEEPEMDKMLSSRQKNDSKNIWRDSSVEIFLIPSANREDNYYQIVVNANASLADYCGKKSLGTGNLDIKWNSNAQVAVSKTKKSWSVELAIPIANLPGLDLQKDFPANFNRNRILSKTGTSYAKLYTWSPFLKRGFQDVDNFGYITFKDVKPLNILKNGSFTGKVEKNLFAGWIFPAKLSENILWSVINDSFPTSGKCLKMTRKISGRGVFFARQYLPELLPNTRYLLQFSLKINNFNRCPGLAKYSGVVVNIWDDKNNWYPQKFYTSDMPWSRQGFEFKTGKNTNKHPHRSYINLMIRNAACSVYWADFKITELNKNFEK